MKQYFSFPHMVMAVFCLVVFLLIITDGHRPIMPWDRHNDTIPIEIVKIETDTIYLDTLAVKVDSLMGITARLYEKLKQAKHLVADKKQQEKYIRHLHDSIATLEYNKWRADITALNLPQTHVTYRGSNSNAEYKLEIAGTVNPTLEDLKIRIKPKRWHFGLSSGVGLTGDGKVTPFIGATVTYSLYSW